jgi:Protein of unknown function, DUF547
MRLVCSIARIAASVTLLSISLRASPSIPVTLVSLPAGESHPARTGQTASPAAGLHRPFDEILDLYVRDGFVYYNAVRSDRAKLDRYLASLNGSAATEHARGSRAQQLALWINAYNALVLRTVIDNWPIRGRSAEFPVPSIRQIPGAFDRLTHRVAGRAVTLDGIEKEILTPLGDARALLALGRGAVGGGRLRSEAFDAAKIDTQLAAVAAESMRRKEIAQIDPAANQLRVSPIFSWREAAFVASLADKADALFKDRSPLERAVLALIEPHLVGAEADFLEKNSFRVVFEDFDWRLNDLSTRSP